MTCAAVTPSRNVIRKVLPVTSEGSDSRATDASLTRAKTTGAVGHSVFRHSSTCRSPSIPSTRITPIGFPSYFCAIVDRMIASYSGPVEPKRTTSKNSA